MKKNNKCQICGKKVWKGNIRCQKCYHKSRIVRIKKYYCKDCGKKIIYKCKRCQSCNTKWRHKIGSLNNKGKNNGNFGKEWTKERKLKQSKRMKKAWNNPIISEKLKKNHADVLGKNNPNYIHGKGYEPYTKEFTQQLRNRIRQRDNFTCQNCGMTEEEHIMVYSRALEIHHIDYNRKNCNKNNLITTCKPCNIRANIDRDYYYAYFMYKTGQEIKEGR